MTFAKLLDQLSKVCTSWNDEIVFRLENSKELFNFGGWNLTGKPYVYVYPTFSNNNTFANIVDYSVEFIRDGLWGGYENRKGWYLLRDFLIGDYFYCPYDDEIKFYKKEISCVKERIGYLEKYLECSKRVKQSIKKTFVVVEVSSKCKRRRYGTNFKEFRHKNPLRFNQSWYLSYKFEMEE